MVATTASRERGDVEVLNNFDGCVLRQWVSTMLEDPASEEAYTDALMTDVVAWERAIDTGIMLFYPWLLDGKFAGAAYLHDLVRAGPEAPSYGWLGGYVLPQARGKPTRDAWRLIRHHAEAQGLTRFFTACRVRNRPAQMNAVRTLRFRRAGVCQDFAYFGGNLDACVIFTQHAEDAALVMHVAEQRAIRARAAGPPRLRCF